MTPRSIFIFTLLSLLAFAPLRAAEKIDARLQMDLERVYGAWKTSMIQKDIDAWSKHTARARQMQVRNLIVSQKRDWPRALFSLALAPPEIRGLRLAGTREVGNQARLIYFGTIDFHLDDPRTPPENALLIDFARETTGWKYFSSRYLNFTRDPALTASAKSGDFSFLDKPEFALTGTPPAVPKPCPIPFYAGQIQVSSYGYETRVTLGDFHEDAISDNETTNMILGGLQRGNNPLKIDLTPIPGRKPEERSVEIVVFVVISNDTKSPAREVFRWSPPTPVGLHYEVPVPVSAISLADPTKSRLIPSN